MRTRFIALLCSVVTAGTALAQTPAPAASVPRVVRLDGQLVPANGLPPAAIETVTLSVYASETDQTPLWSETQDVRVDAQGRYAVFLGASAAEGIPSGVLSGEARWLGIHFARPGEVEQARVPITSVPYAIKASDADTLGGLPPSAFLRSRKGAAKGATTRASSGTDTPAGDPGPAANSGTPNFIGKFVDSIDLTSSVIYESSGRIGVGTGAATPLDIVHSKFTDASGGLTGLAVQNMSGGATAYSGMLFYDHTGALRQFQGYNNSNGEYRINNIAPGGSINFMLGSSSKFLVGSNGDIAIAGNLTKGGSTLLSTGGFNVGVGPSTLANVGAGTENTAVGDNALSTVTTNFRNVAVGRRALEATNGAESTAVGYRSFMSNLVGSGNIGLGAFTGSDQTSGDTNMYLGYDVGRTANEFDTIRVGDSGYYTRFFTGAIRGVTTGQSNAVAVVIDSNGQLGTVNSSRRYKEDIQDMGKASSGLMKLRPVTYRYAQAYADGTKPLDYGLIAEEVKEVYPDLVAHLKNGDVETVQYHKINAMLLNEVQKQHRQIGEQQSEIDALKARLAALERLLTREQR